MHACPLPYRKKCMQTCSRTGEFSMRRFSLAFPINQFHRSKLPKKTKTKNRSFLLSFVWNLPYFKLPYLIVWVKIRIYFFSLVPNSKKHPPLTSTTINTASPAVRSSHPSFSRRFNTLLHTIQDLLGSHFILRECCISHRYIFTPPLFIHHSPLISNRKILDLTE